MSDNAASAAVEQTSETAGQRETRQSSQTRRQPPYNVILWNDDDHSYVYVIAMLGELFGYPPEKGYMLAKEVDNQGRVIVMTTTMERAELKRDQIHAYGKDGLIQDCKGSMRASIEPAPGE
ncbi:MAG: ATP-dependent Clp protease adaptor ClpS [Thermoguttaceae bacterium]|jgi:ATP-dependent Clp protease adaptor protein ClpS